MKYFLESFVNITPEIWNSVHTHLSLFTAGDCEIGWTKFWGRCIIQPSSSKQDFQGARSACQAINATLISFSNLQQIEELIKTLPGTTSFLCLLFAHSKYYEGYWPSVTRDFGDIVNGILTKCYKRLWWHSKWDTDQVFTSDFGKGGYWPNVTRDFGDIINGILAKCCMRLC